MNIKDLSNKNVCILGFGREGKAMAEAIEKHAKNTKITIADQSDSLPATRYPLLSGEKAFEELDSFDVIIKSPGIPPHALLPSVQYTTPTQIFFDSIVGSGATVIGVTGSKGKSTTTSLIYHILSTRNPLPARSGSEDPSGSRTTTRQYLIGNIGNPSISYIDQAKKGTIFVMEMSSYQLMDLDTSPKIAVLTSFFPEHLDYHRSMKAYMDAKKHITKFQTASDVVFFNASNTDCEEIAEEGEGKKIPVTADDAPCAITETKLIGEHNRSNIALAWKVAEHLGVKKEDAVKAIASFTPLAHRLQSLGTHHGMEWVNDSISTTPDSAMAAMDALGDRVAVIILGGQDRGQDFSALAKKIKESKVQAVITVGEAGPEIAALLRGIGCTQWMIEVPNLEAAVREAKLQKPSIKQPIVLLSPAAPSYDQFKNFEERGKQFGELLTK